MKCWSHQNSVSAHLAFPILHNLGSSYLEIAPPTVKRDLLTSTNLFKITHHTHTQRPVLTGNLGFFPILFFDYYYRLTLFSLNSQTDERILNVIHIKTGL